MKKIDLGRVVVTGDGGEVVRGTLTQFVHCKPSGEKYFTSRPFKMSCDDGKAWWFSFNQLNSGLIRHRILPEKEYVSLVKGGTDEAIGK